MSTQGYIHSVETFGTVDGPGIRFIVFTSGCRLRCQYCHNPDTWKMDDGTLTTTDELIKDILRYKTYMKSTGGGVTISGGEPLLQPAFVKELIDKLHQNDLTVAIDTCGFPDINDNNVKETVDAADLILLDIKSINPQTYKKVTLQELQATLNFADYLNKINKPTWLRFVYVPGLTDDREDVIKLAQYVSTMKNIQLVEVLPFHKFGEHKWEMLGLTYKLSNTPEPTKEQTEEIREIFRSFGLKVQ